MRISDWSSDVCSSDLRVNERKVRQRHAGASVRSRVSLPHFPFASSLGRSRWPQLIRRNSLNKQTICIHEGYQAYPTTKSCAVPIPQTVSYDFDDARPGDDPFAQMVAGNI